MKQRILITGGLGFVGMQLAFWMSSDYDVVVSDIRGPNKEEESFLTLEGKKPIFRHLDVLDYREILAVLEEEKISHVIHGAAITSGYQDNALGRAGAARLNVGGTLNMLEACERLLEVKTMLFLSSSGIYIGSVPKDGELQREEGDFPLDNLYALTKRTAEMILEGFTQRDGTRVASLRLGSVYGPFEKKTETRHNLSQVGYLSKALIESRGVGVYGKTITRDWIFGSDLALAVDKLIKAENWNHSVYNLSSGESTSFEHIIEVFRHEGLKAEWAAAAEDADLFMNDKSWRAALDISRLKEDVGFTPEVSVAEGIPEQLRIERLLQY